MTDKVVLLGDAAHTTHFSTGVGTALAMTDATVLARSIQEHGEDVPAALATIPAIRVRRALDGAAVAFPQRDRVAG